MTIGKGAMMDVAGLSIWQTVTLKTADAQIRLMDEGTLTTDDLTFAVIDDKQDFASYVKVLKETRATSKAALNVSDSMTVKSFADADASFTMDGKAETPVVIDKRTELGFGSQADYDQKEDGMLAGLNRAIGTVNFLNYEAVWTPAEEEDKDSGKEEGKGHDHACEGRFLEYERIRQDRGLRQREDQLHRQHLRRLEGQGPLQRIAQNRGTQLQVLGHEAQVQA